MVEVIEDDNFACRPPKKLETSEWTVSALRCCGGGGTGLEFVINLQDPTDGYGNKWYDSYPAQTWIQADFKKPINVRGFSIKSANDCEHRDPYKIEVLALYENETEKIKLLTMAAKAGNIAVEQFQLLPVLAQLPQ